MKLSIALLVAPVAALAPQAERSSAKKVLDRRAVGTGLLTAIGGFTAQAASAAAGESPKFSFFGIGGNADTYSEGGAYGMDQKAEVYSPYSVYSKIGSDEALYKKFNKDEMKFKKQLFAESSKRVAKVDTYIKAKKWEEVRSELERQVYSMREMMNGLAAASGNPKAKATAVQFYKDMELVDLLCKRKKQEAALEAYTAMMGDLDAFAKLI